MERKTGRSAGLGSLVAVALAGCGAPTVVVTPAEAPSVTVVESPPEIGRMEPEAATPPVPAATPQPAPEPAPPPAELAEPPPDAVQERIRQQTQVQDALQRGDWRAALALLRGDLPEPEHPDWQLLVLRQAELQLQASLVVLSSRSPAPAPAEALQALADARAALQRAPALTAQHGKTVDAAARQVRKQSSRALADNERAAQRVRAPAAAWLYHWIGQTALGGKPATLAQRRAAAEQVAGADVLMQVLAAPEAGQEPQANGGLKGLHDRVAAELKSLGTDGRLVRVLAARPRRGVEPWLLQVNIVRLHIVRERKTEERTGRFLDRMETVANPDWRRNHGMAAARLAELNVARDALQPVLDQVNAAESRIHQLQEQLAQIMQQVADDNAKYYQGKPSPCKDRSLQCAETWGYKRWQPNIEYYQTRLTKENQTLETLAPELNRLESAVAAAQRAWEEAQRKAEETPEQMPQEVWLDHRYEVEVETLRSQLEVRALLRTASGEGYATQQRVTVFGKEWSDFASPAVVVKGQVLQAEHAIALPDDPSAVAGLVEVAVRDAVLPLLPAVSGHAQRWVREAGDQAAAMQRLERLCRAWLAARALEPAVRTQVAEQIAALTGFDVRTGTLFDAARALNLPQ